MFSLQIVENQFLCPHNVRPECLRRLSEGASQREQEGRPLDCE
jgi:hypothetical protein